MSIICPNCGKEVSPEEENNLTECPSCKSDLAFSDNSTPTLKIAKKTEEENSDEDTFLDLNAPIQPPHIDFKLTLNRYQEKGRVCPICGRKKAPILIKLDNEAYKDTVKIIVNTVQNWKPIMGICTLCLDYYHQYRIRQ